MRPALIRATLTLLCAALLVAPAGCQEQATCPVAGADQGADGAAGDGAAGPDVGLPATPVTPAELIEACVRLTACGVKAYSRVSDCVAGYLDLAIPQGLGAIQDRLHRCVNAARGDCQEVARCAGRRGACDFDYKASCEGAVAVSCDLLDKRVYAVDCAVAGLKCGLRAGQSAVAECHAAVCTTGDKAKCAGDRLYTCSGGLTDVHDCLADGKFCWPGDSKTSASCRGNRRSSCEVKSYKPSCLGTVAVTCEGGRLQWTDCARRKLVTTTCSAGLCANSASTCKDDFDRCSGDKLEACMDGLWKALDCAALGLGKCHKVSYSGRCSPPTP